MVGSLQAQTTVQVHFPGQKKPGAGGDPAHPAATFDVTVTPENSTTFDFTVHNATAPFQAFLDDVYFTFYDDHGGNLGGGSPFTIHSAHAMANGMNVPLFNFVVDNDTTVQFQNPENHFFAPGDVKGQIVLDNPSNDPVLSFNVELQDGQHADANGDFVPEASSLALLLPGLIPVGILVRRRRAARA